MGTLNFLVAIANFFIAGVQFGLWLDTRKTGSLAWMVTNLGCGVFCLITGVGIIVKQNIGV